MRPALLALALMLASPAQAPGEGCPVPLMWNDTTDTYYCAPDEALRRTVWEKT